MLDRGALGVVVPFVNSVEDAQAAAFAMRYPPRGGRSYGFTLAEYHGAGYGDWIDDQVYLGVQIESAEAVARAEDILAVDGSRWLLDRADGFGRVAGHTTRHTEAHTAAILSVLAACRKVGKVPGIHTYGVADAGRWLDAGFRFVTVASEIGLLLDGGKQALRTLGRL